MTPPSAKPIHSGLRPRRYLKPEDDPDNPVPDMLHLEDGTFVVNPEWETAPYEEVLGVFKNGKFKPVEGALRSDLHMPKWHKQDYSGRKR